MITEKTMKELKDELIRVTEQCSTCQIFKKPPPSIPQRPIIVLPIAARLQEYFGMDLKFCIKHLFLHMIDHATRFSATALISSKRPEVIIQKIFQTRISLSGVPEKVLL